MLPFYGPKEGVPTHDRIPDPKQYSLSRFRLPLPLISCRDQKDGASAAERIVLSREAGLYEAAPSRPIFTVFL